MNDSIEALSTGDMELAQSVKRQERRLNELEEKLRQRHMERLNRRQCSPEFTVIYTDVVHHIENIGDSCDNIADRVLEDINFKNSSAEKTSGECE